MQLLGDAKTAPICRDRPDRDRPGMTSAHSDDYSRGFADGFEAGYSHGIADRDDEWQIALGPARAAARIAARHPDFAELERRRWGPGGRSHFANPRPGDYPGERGAA
jgi:hypothetical protein